MKKKLFLIFILFIFASINSNASENPYKFLKKEILIGKAKKNETCVYSIPAKPIDQTREVSYHEDVLKQIIETYGYDVKVIEESVALAYEGLVDNDLTCLLYTSPSPRDS